MSISLVLLPLAVSAVAAAHTASSGTDAGGRVVCRVTTRMRDVDLLADALLDVEAVVTVGGDPDHLTATWQGTRAEFSRDAEGTWSAHLRGDVDEERARGIVAAVDAAYGRRVQAAVLERLRDRAPAAGLRIESEQRHDDDSVHLVLTPSA